MPQPCGRQEVWQRLAPPRAVAAARRGWATRWLVLVVALTLTATGCVSSILPPAKQARSILQKVEGPERGVILDVLVVQRPLGDPALNDQLWSQVDEQQLSTELRRDLALNGLRAGIVAGDLPVPLAKLIREAENASSRSQQADQLQSIPTVTRDVLKVHFHRRRDIVSCPETTQASLLFHEGGQVVGQTLNLPSGVLALHAEPIDARQARLVVTPELQFGTPRSEVVGTDSGFRMQTKKPSREFENLTMKVPAASGRMLLVGCLPQRPGSLGSFLMSQPMAGQVMQKLLIVRLVRISWDGRDPLAGKIPDSEMIFPALKARSRRALKQKASGGTTLDPSLVRREEAPERPQESRLAPPSSGEDAATGERPEELETTIPDAQAAGL